MCSAARREVLHLHAALRGRRGHRGGQSASVRCLQSGFQRRLPQLLFKLLALGVQFEVLSVVLNSTELYVRVFTHPVSELFLFDGETSMACLLHVRWSYGTYRI